MLKRVLTMTLALMLVFGCFTGISVSAEENETGFVAGLGLVASDWSTQTGFGADSTVKTTVTDDGTYTLTYEGACADLGILLVDVVGASAALAENNEAYRVSEITLTIDGNEVAIDESKVLCGDLEGNGNFRIELYNMYGDSKNDPCLDNTTAVTTSLTLSFKLTTVKTAFDAGLGLVASDWSTQTGFGADSTVKTTVSGDGTYTLTYEGACADLGILLVDIVGAKAALEAENKTYQVSDIVLTIDGNEVAIDESKVLCGDLEGNGNFRIDLYNMYGDSKNDPCLDNTIAVTTGLTLSFKLTTVSTVSFEAGLGLVASDWSTQTGFGAESTVKTTISGDGTYTLTYEGACADLGILLVDIVGANAVLKAEGKTYQVSDIVLTIDGNEIAVDQSKVLCGDLEENGNFRIDLYNMYGDSKNDPCLDNTTAVTTSLSLSFTLTTVEDTTAGGDEGNDDSGTTEPALEFNPDGVYNAYLLLQTPMWNYRNAWNDSNGMDSEYWGNALWGNDTKEWYGKITDAVLAGNGTYTIEITDFGTLFEDDFLNAGQDYFNIIGFSTDAPLGGLTITNVKLIIDGSTKHTQSEGYQDPDTTDYTKILIQNKWNSDVAEISYYPAPTTSLKIEFTVTGFSYDKAAEGDNGTSGGDNGTTTPDATQPADSSANDSEGSNTGVIIAVVAVVVVAVAVVVVVVLKKKKN